MHSPWPSSVGDLEFRTPTPADVAQVVAIGFLDMVDGIEPVHGPDERYGYALLADEWRG